MVKRVNKNIKKNNNLLKKKKPKESEDKNSIKNEEISEKSENEKEEIDEEITENKQQQNELENLNEIMNKNINSNLNTGVIYIGHLPWGFEEKALKKYFNQFGEITRLIVPRSKKHAQRHFLRSQHSLRQRHVEHDSAVARKREEHR